MLFNSYIFVFLFLPITLMGFYGLNYIKQYNAAKIFLLIMSLWFYGYFNKRYLLILVCSVIANYVLSKLMDRCKIERVRQVVLLFGIFLNVAVIFYFKYFDFFIDNVNIVFKASLQHKNILLPLGISFFTFQQISYLVDSYRGETKDYSFGEYALFVTFFPQLIAGPIVLHKEMIPQFRDSKNACFHAENFAKGMYIFSIGMFKKVIIADTFGVAVSFGFGNVDTLSAIEAVIVSLAYTFQLYFDFSGYCDMAIGIGNFFNIKLPQNFNSPYRATSIVDFWDRWHMSLTRFLRTYIYFPLGGNRKGKIRTYINILVVYLVSGIWHGANWTFIIWGLLHGVFSCLNRVFQKSWSKLHEVTRWFLTFVTVNFLWVFFRSESISKAILFIKKMFDFRNIAIRDELYNCFMLPEITAFSSLPILRFAKGYIMYYALWVFILGAFFIVLNLPNSKEVEFRPTIGKSIATVVLLVWSVVSFTGISTFLYFNF